MVYNFFYFLLFLKSQHKNLRILKSDRYLSEFALFIRHFGQLENFPETESLPLLLQRKPNYPHWVYQNTPTAAISNEYPKPELTRKAGKLRLRRSSMIIGFVWPIAAFIAYHSLVNYLKRDFLSYALQNHKKIKNIFFPLYSVILLKQWNSNSNSNSNYITFLAEGSSKKRSHSCVWTVLVLLQDWRFDMAGE